jgi:hypothetical protein
MRDFRWKSANGTEHAGEKSKDSAQNPRMPRCGAPDMQTRAIRDLSVPQHDDGCAEMAAGIVVERLDEWVCTQYLVHAGTLHADASPMHEAHKAKSDGMSFLQIGIHDVRDVARRERMEIELRPDGNDVGGIH